MTYAFKPHQLNLGATAVDALSVGYRTILIDDCCRGTDVHDIEHTKEKVISNHGVVVHSSEVSKDFKCFFLTIESL